MVGTEEQLTCCSLATRTSASYSFEGRDDQETKEDVESERNADTVRKSICNGMATAPHTSFRHRGVAIRCNRERKYLKTLRAKRDAWENVVARRIR